MPEHTLRPEPDRTGPSPHHAATTATVRYQALVICAHLRPGRDKRRSRYFMQPLTGLHIGSQIDRTIFDVRLHHEDWHGPFDSADCKGWDLVFLTGLQPDFDRMRQLSYFFRRAGSTVVAGGSICTLFPEFAAQFFDSVCAGGIDSVQDVVSNFLEGRLKPIYNSPITKISQYAVDYRLFSEAGISPLAHLLETSRGCRFKCSFCVIPVEAGGHATYDTAAVKAAFESSLSSSPRLSFRRWYPIVLLLDNNFSDNRAYMQTICELMLRHRKIRGWAALVTQDILHDRELVARLARSKCVGLFAGIESFDMEMLRRFRKTQNLSRRSNVIDDVMFAESQGIAVCYGYLFDPRHQTAQEMQRQITAIAEHPELPMPVYLSVIAPLAGTESFWQDLAAGALAPNLRLRDLDGETLAYSRLADEPAALVDFIERLFRRPWTVVGRMRILLKTIRRLLRSGTFNPIRWHIIASANLHCFVWSRATPSKPRCYIAGIETLDAQYSECPLDLSDEDRQRYFEPIALTDGAGRPAVWLQPYVPAVPTRFQPSIGPSIADLCGPVQPSG